MGAVKIDKLNRILKNWKGEDYEDSDGDKLTLKGAMVGALVGGTPGENPDGKTKYQRYRIAQMLLNREDEVELTSEEAAEIKKVVALVYFPQVVGQVWDAIEGDGEDVRGE